MDKELKGQIIKDWIVAYKYIDEIVTGKIVTGKKGNWWVLKPHQYLSPSIRSNILPLDDKDGEFIHYNQICETLEKLLAGERAKYTGRFREAPDEIKQLLDKVA